MITTQNENYNLRLYKRNENTEEYETSPSMTFKGRPANAMEKKSYRLMQGVVGNQESVFIYASNLPLNVKVHDKVEFLGQIKVVQSIGYYFDDNLFIDVSLFSPEYIFENSPKGITLG